MSNISRLKALEKLLSPVDTFTMFYSDEALFEYFEERGKFMNGEITRAETLTEFCERRYKESNDKRYTLQRVKETKYSKKEYSLMISLVMERAKELEEQKTRRN